MKDSGAECVPRERPDGSSGEVQVFGKIAAILDVLAAGIDDLGLTEIAKRAHLHKSTTHRLLATLLRHGYVEQGAQPGTYRLGWQVFRLGAAVQWRYELRHRVRPVLLDLARATEESASLVIPLAREALCIDRVEGKHANLLAMRIGTTLPLHAGAASRVLLAAMTDAAIDLVLQAAPTALTRFTEVQPRRLWELLHEVRRQGYAISDEDVALGVAAVAAPIWDGAGHVVGALSVSGSRRRLTPDRMPILTAQVTTAAQRITGGLTATSRAAD